MALTRNFKDTVKARMESDSEFRAHLISEALQLMIDGDVETGKSLLRDYINATTGFERLAQEVNKKPESLMRMFSPKGNPQTNNLFPIIRALVQMTRVKVLITAQC